MEKLIDYKAMIKYLIIITISLILGGIIYHNYFEKEKVVDLNSGNIYETKEITKSSEFIEDTLLNSEMVKPKIIIRYLSPEPIKIDSARIIGEYINIHYKNSTNGLVFRENIEKDTISQLLTVKPEFILNYPDSWKLLNMDIVKDSLTLTTMDYDANIKTQSYPIYLESYNYNWSHQKLSKSESKNKTTVSKTNKLKWNELYINGGYDIYTSYPTIGTEWNLTPGRIKLDVNADVIIKSAPTLNLNAKVGYRLFK